MRRRFIDNVYECFRIVLGVRKPDGQGNFGKRKVCFLHKLDRTVDPRKDVAEQEVSEEFVCLLEERRAVSISHSGGSGINFLKEKMVDYGEIFVCPVLAGGDVIGSVLFVRPERQKGISEEICQKLAQCAAAFLGSQMET